MGNGLDGEKFLEREKQSVEIGLVCVIVIFCRCFICVSEEEQESGQESESGLISFVVIFHFPQTSGTWDRDAATQ